MPEITVTKSNNDNNDINVLQVVCMKNDNNTPSTLYTDKMPRYRRENRTMPL